MQDLGRASHDDTRPNGIEVNGMELNGMELNGMELNGMELNGMELNGMELNGMELNGMELNGVLFSGHLAEGTPLSTYDFIGVTFRQPPSNGSVVRLRIDDIRPGTAPNDDLLLYAVSFETRDGWKPLCGTDASGAPRLAIPLSGYWDRTGTKVSDPSRFTFACRGYALAKCVELGYKPWETVGGVSLEAHHQACTRMIRADYCGDGTSWTVDGRLINLYDAVGIQSDVASWAFEAEWDANGARCVHAMRVRLIEGKYTALPPCIRARVAQACGSSSHFGSGTLLMSEFKTTYVAQP
jgi:hypothetical protein